MLSKLSIRSKMAVVVVLPLVALALVAVIGWQVLAKNTIGSNTYDEIREATDLEAAIFPPTQYIIEAHLDVEELVAEADPGRRANLLASVFDARTTYERGQIEWRVRLAEEPAILARMETSYLAGIEWFDLIEQELVPLSNAGDIVAMQTIDDQKLNVVFEKHRSEILQLTDLALARQVELETGALDRAERDSRLVAILLIALAAGSALLAFVIARSIVGPVRQLTAGARNAEAGLPKLLASLNAAEEPEMPELVRVDSDDELSELANALNSMQSAAVGLASDQARSRRNVSLMLANLARRNQGLLNRTLSFITRLEENERDPEMLDNLFKLDHLTTRMRRNAESLLVLAGSEAPRSWAQPIDGGDVIRAAMSEIEAFDRVEVTSMDPVMVRGNAVSDVAHLLAELLDNATRFSPPSTTVSIVGKDTESGYLISIVDQGMGMAAEQLASANRDIETVGRFEEGSTMVLGLAVVARLAARNGVTVRLSESPFEGVTAQVRLPLDVLDRGGQAGGALVPAAATLDSAAFSAPSNGVSSNGWSQSAPVPGVHKPAASAPTSFAPPAAGSSRGLSVPPTRPFDSLPPPAARASNATGNLQRRVPGTNLFESTLPVAGPTPDIERSAEEIRDALSSFQHGFQSAPKPGAEVER